MKNTKIAVLALSVVTLFSSSVYAKTFKDVTKTGQFQWIYSELDMLSNRGVFGGYPEGDFRPNKPVTLLEILQVIKNIKNPSAEVINASKSNYSEIIKANNVPEWAVDAVAYALNNNIITTSTLEQANSRGFLKDINPTYPDRNSVTVYFGKAFDFPGDGNKNNLKHSDLSDVPEVTIGYLSNMVDAGIFAATGSEGKFNGKSYIRRAEVVSVAAKAIKYLEGNQSTPSTPNNDNVSTESLLTNTVEVNGIVDKVDLNNSIVNMNDIDYPIINNVKINGLNSSNLSDLVNREVTLKLVDNSVTEITVKAETNSAKYNARLVGKIVNLSNEDGMNRLEIRILVSNNSSIVSGSDVVIKTIQNHNIGDVITFDAKVDNGYIVEVNIQR